MHLKALLFFFFFDRCWFCHKTSGQCHQTNSSDQPGWGQSGGENHEHLQEHWDLLQAGRGVRWDHTRWPTRQSKLSQSQDVILTVSQRCALRLFEFSLVLVLAVHLLHGGRQTRASAEVGRQGDQICQRNQGWEDGYGKIKYHTQLAYYINPYSGKQVIVITFMNLWSHLLHKQSCAYAKHCELPCWNMLCK